MTTRQANIVIYLCGTGCLCITAGRVGFNHRFWGELILLTAYSLYVVWCYPVPQKVKEN